MLEVIEEFIVVDTTNYSLAQCENDRNEAVGMVTISSRNNDSFAMRNSHLLKEDVEGSLDKAFRLIKSSNAPICK